jgi:hypothetical protein
MNALRNNPVLIARKTVVEACRTEPELALKYLERKRKNEFSTKQEVENKVDISINKESQAFLEELDNF